MPVDAEALTHGALRVEGQLTTASNATLLCTLIDSGDLCVYKPQAGERELWDFPTDTLGRREVATYALAQTLGWDLIPTTVWRPDGPFGPGMCQQWIEGVPDLVDVTTADVIPAGWRRVLRGRDEAGTPVTLIHADRPDLQYLAALDAIVNNADRKGGHILQDGVGHLWAIDHGVTFATEPKLRTVLWGWTGEGVPGPILDDVAHLMARGEQGLGALLDPWLSTAEIQATWDRLAALAQTRRFPEPSATWPSIPWPVM